jgi:hypothetical protein
MKKISFLAVLFLSLGFVSSLVQAQAFQDFTMTNNTGMILVDVYISPDNSNNWGSDVIPKDLILDGETFEFKFGVDQEHCVWDIKFTADDGVEYYMQDVNLCTITSITLSKQ